MAPTRKQPRDNDELTSENTRSDSKKAEHSRHPIARTLLDEVILKDGSIHPALIPGIGVAESDAKFQINRKLFAVTGLFILAFIAWGLLDNERLGQFSGVAVDWVATNFGWLFSGLTVAVVAFMLIVGYSSRGNIRLGADDEEPEFSRASWIAMLFSAGVGIGLLFYGAYEPMAYFLDVPPGFESEAGTVEAMHHAMSQTLLHWGPMAWTYYALVGGAIAYAAYRRGRSPLISSVFDPIFSERLKGPIGAIIDGFSIIVTLFGTAVSLGLGALQIGRGVEIVAGLPPLGNAAIVAIMVILTIGFIFSAVSGIKRGIRKLSNLNMLLVLGLAIFVFATGPTLFLLDFVPTSAFAYFSDLGEMLIRFPSQGADEAAFMQAWTTYYWAWWVSWTPFVGMFVAKISRGRTLREFVTVVVVVPSTVCLLWFGIFGGTAMRLEQQGQEIMTDRVEDVLFRMFDQLPLSIVISAVAVFALGIFFVTSADSASLVMGTMTERGRPQPHRFVTISWGIALSAIAIVLLLAGGQDSLSALQALVTVSALPFTLVLIGLMISWWRELTTDPWMLRRRYASVAIDEGVRLGIEEHGDDFVFSAGAVEPEQGAGAWLDSENPDLTQWYEQAVSETREAEAEARAALVEAQEARRGADEAIAIASAAAQQAEGASTDHGELEGAQDPDTGDGASH